MATLPRPGVEISQEIVTAAPTILTPTLVPCIIGPCFQIVKPLTEVGGLNAEAQVSIAAVLTSNNSLGEELNLSGRTMVLNINGSGDQTVQFPVTIDNATLSQALVENTINKQLSGAVAEFIENKLVIRTAAKGPTASIKVIEVESDSAYGEGADDILSLNSMVGRTVSGKTAYTNSGYTIPYSSFPSPKTDVSEIVLDEDAIDVFLFFGSLKQLSENSAPAMNSYHVGTSKIGGGSCSIAHQPALSAGSGGRVSLYGRPLANGSKTNIIAHPGTEASLMLPLCHDVASAGADTTWPDVTGGNNIHISCIGKSAFLSSGNSSDMGTIDGAAGNDISVEVNAAGPAGGCVVTFAGSVLTISGSTTTTFSSIADALSSPELQSSIAGAISIEMNQAADDESICDFSKFTTTSYNLGGGSDPVDFSADPGTDDDGNDLTKAYVCGTTKVGAQSASDLDIGGETLSVMIDGGDAINIILSADDAVVDTINTGLGDSGSATAITAKNALGESIVGLLQISSSSTDGHDSTIELSASSALVMEKLFGGAATATEAITEDISVADVGLSERKLKIEGGTDYNASAESILMKAIQPSSTEVEISGLLGMAGILLDQPVLTSIEAATVELGVTTEGATSTITLTIADCDTAQNTANAINTALGGVPALSGISATRAMDESKILLFHTGVAGSSFSLHEDSTTESLRALWSDVYESEVTSEVVSAIVSDGGANSALQIDSVSNSMAHVLSSGSVNATSLALSTDSVIAYSSGNIDIVFSGDEEAAPVTAATLKVSGGTTASISYRRVWANNCQAGVPDYSGRSFQGMSSAVEISDSLLNNGSMIGRVVAIEGFSVGSSSYPGGQLVVSEFGVDNKDFLSGWLIRAENLVSGDGRVSPEVEADNVSRTVAIKHGLLRSEAGLAMSNVTAPVYVGYQALRKDVSADTANPQLLVFNSASEVETFIGPIEPANPLAFGMYWAFINSTNINISAIGVSEVTADAPFGTLEAYAEALDFLEMKEVYALAPLTSDMGVFQKFSQHVRDMSAPVAKKERMAICCPSLPTEESPILVESGTMILSPPEGIGGGKYNVSLALQSEIDQKTLHMAINGKTDANGAAISAAEGSSFTPDQGIYLDREGDANRYLIVGTPDASTITIETSDVYHPGLSGPGTGGNGDSFFKTGASAQSALSSWEADGEACTIFIRQPAIDSKTTGGRLKICEGLAEIAGGVTGFQNRRLLLVQPELVGVNFGGMEVGVDGFYLSAGIAAMIGQQPPSQPFTNLPMTGFTRPIGSSDKFSDNQMSTAAAGGVYWVIQDVEGGALASRHQLTTDVSSLKTRELSILKSVDFVSKLIRAQIKNFIGRRNITRSLLESVSLGISGSLAGVSGSVVAAASLDKIMQDPANPDSIICDVSITPYYPANKISVTIFV